MAGHVLAGPLGTAIPAALQAGANVLEIVAVNEGTVGPKTAELEISDVSEGQAVQVWRLTAGQTGALTISAP